MTSPLDVNVILSLYNQNRFHDANAICDWILKEPEQHADHLSCDELIHLGRLSGRLGSSKKQGIFYNKATEMEPDHPLVVYYARRFKGETHVAEDLRFIENNPEPKFSDPEFYSSWYGSNACLYAFVRDFDQAERMLEKARSYGCNREWVASCAADVLFRQDRWDDALVQATTAFEISPHMPSGSSILARILAKKGEIDRINQLFSPWIESCQTYEFLLTAIWYLCVKAERAEGADRIRWAAKASELASKLESLAILADEDLITKFCVCRMDIAMLMEDYEGLRRHGEGTDIPFYKKMVDHVSSHPHGKRRMAPYRPVFQKHLTCLPASAATVMGAFDIHIDEDALAHELTYNGTAIWRMEEWLLTQGYEAQSFVLSPELMVRLIENGLPFVNITEYTNSSHATAVVGVDHRTGTFLVHDPSSERMTHVLMDGFTEGEYPLGPMGLAIVPREQKQLLDLIPEEACKPADACKAYLKYLDLNVPDYAHQRLEDCPDPYFSRRFEALIKAYQGHVYQAIEIQKSLLKEFPDCIIVQRELLNNLYRTRNKSLIRKILKTIVTKGKMPGISKQQEWQYPPTSYACQYADYLGDNAEGYAEAEKLLVDTLKRDPWAAESYHILGDILIRQNRDAEAVIPFRVAAFMNQFHEHYAREACNAYRQVGREKEGLAFLILRMQRLSDKIHGSEAAITLIEAYLDFGYPGEAIDTMKRCLLWWGDDPHMTSYAVEFWVRMGEWDRAERALTAVEETGHRVLYLSAAVHYYREAGHWEKALELAGTWVDTRPNDIRARREYLNGIKRKDGRGKALDLAGQWMNEFKNDEAFEELYYDQLRPLHKTREQEAVIRKRIRRNPYDIWAWHELGFLILGRAELLAGDARKSMLGEMNEVLERIDKIAPDHAVSHVLKGDMLSSRKEFTQAVRHYFKAIEDDPAYSYAYSRIWEASTTFSTDQQMRLMDRLEDRIFKTVGFLYHVRVLAFRMAERFGAKKTEETLRRWVAKRPDDPEIIEAQVDLLLNYGQGRSDARKAADILEPALKRFPNHFDLRASLAQAYTILLMHDEEEAELREMIRRHPLNSHARNTLAGILSRTGKEEEAMALLRTGMDYNPLDDSCLTTLAQVLWDRGAYKDALDVLARGLKRMPELISLRRIFSQRLQEAGEDQAAVDVLRQGIGIYPDGAYLWYLYGEALWRSSSHTDTQDIEQAFRKSLELNHTIFEAADSLAMLLADQSRFGEARDLMKHQIGILDEPEAAHGRNAWITRQEGKKREALNDLHRIVTTWPTYAWAWSLLIQWLEEDEAYDEARDILKTVHPVMADNPRFIADRLMLLKKAGVPMNELSPQWDALLSDFPRYERLHTLWIDQLIQDEVYEQADKILQGLERFYPESPYTLVRRVWLHVEKNQFDDAVACACNIWLKPGNGDEWPDSRAWNIIRDAGYMTSSLEALWPVAKSGQRIRPGTFLNLVENLSHLEVRGRFMVDMIPFKWFFISPTEDRLRCLLSVARTREWDKGQYQAMILDEMLDLGFSAYVKAYARANPGLCFENKAIRQSLGRLHMTGKRKDYLFVRKLMAGWREQKGSEMWAVANYVTCLRRRRGWSPVPEDLEELYRTTRDLITTVPHDHTVKYIVSVFCEAALRKGLDDEFLALAGQFNHILGDTETGYWMPGHAKRLPEVIALFVRLFNERDKKARKDLTREMMTCLSSYPVKNTGNWIQKEWMKRLSPDLNWFERIKMRILTF